MTVEELIDDLRQVPPMAHVDVQVSSVGDDRVAVLEVKRVQTTVVLVLDFNDCAVLAVR